MTVCSESSSRKETEAMKTTMHLSVSIELYGLPLYSVYISRALPMLRVEGEQI